MNSRKGALVEGGLPHEGQACSGTFVSGVLLTLFSLQLGNTAGIAWRIGEALKELGQRAVVVELEPSLQGFQSDLALHMDSGVPFPIRLVNFTRIVRIAREADVVHFHYGIRPFGRFLRRLCDAPFIAHYHGSDLRNHEADGYRELVVGEFVSTPDLLKLAPRAVWVPNPYPIPPRVAVQRNPSPVLGHFPSNPSKKGTEGILKIVSRLHQEVDFRFKFVTNAKHSDVISEMQTCDVVIDQINELGVYGMVAVEAMALGKVVISSIRPEYYNDCPVVAATESQLEDQLLGIFRDRNSWVEMGNSGKEYVDRVHNPIRVAQLLVSEYQRALESV